VELIRQVVRPTEPHCGIDQLARPDADDPLASVVLGTGKMLSDFRLLRLVSID